MRLLTLITATAAVSLAAGAATAQTRSVEVRDAVARVVVIPETRTDIKVEMLGRNASLPLEVQVHGDRVVVDGGLDRRIRACHGSGEGASVTVAGLGEISWSQMPQLVIRVPRAVVVETGGAVFGSVGRAQSLDFSTTGCGDWTIANVAGRLRYSQAGSGDARMGSSGEASVRLAGSGDVSLTAVAGRLEIDLAGSGDVEAARVTGPVDVKIAGSGDVRLGGGPTGAMTVTVAGSGGVEVDAEVQSLKARIVGSGDVRVKAVKGDVEKSILGSGSVSIG